MHLCALNWRRRWPPAARFERCDLALFHRVRVAHSRWSPFAACGGADDGARMSASRTLAGSGRVQPAVAWPAGECGRVRPARECTTGSFVAEFMASRF